MLLSAGNVGITGTASARNHHVLSMEHTLWLVLHYSNDIVSIFKVSEAVDVLDFFVTQVDASHPVHRLNVILHGLDELLPIDLDTFGLLVFPAVGL